MVKSTVNRDTYVKPESYLGNKVNLGNIAWEQRHDYRLLGKDKQCDYTTINRN